MSEAIDFARLIREGDTIAWSGAAAEPGHLVRMFNAQLDRMPQCSALLGLGMTDTLDAARVAALGMEPEVRWEGIVIRPLATPHAGLEHYSYLVEWNGLRLYFTGDTEDTSALLAARNLDAAFVSPWLLDAVRKQGARIDARQVIVYHHRDGDTPPPVQGRRVPKQGETIELKGAP